MKRAIVIGAGISGLLTARVLSTYFDEVLVLERDKLPDAPHTRSGTPQDRHLHQILAGGQKIIEDLFPNLAQELLAVDAPQLHWGVDNIIVTENGRLPKIESGIITNTCSRVTFEYLIRKLVLADDSVTILSNHQVQSLIMDDNQTITGLTVGKQSSQQLFADFIVDASGKGSKTPEWYTDLGYDKPDYTKIDAHVGYSSCWFENLKDETGDFVMLQVADLASKASNEKGQRSGVIIKVDGERYIALLTSNNKDYPPTDLAGFLDFAKTLRSDTYYNVLKDGTPISPVYGSRSTYNIRYHYEKLKRIPENYILIGDAVCSFDPVIGQGMSMAAVEAQLLNTHLAQWTASSYDGFAKQFQSALAKELTYPWLLATANDKFQPLAEGDIKTYPFIGDLQTGYFNLVLQAMESDRYILIAFFEVLNMLRSPLYLAHPKILWRILRYKLTGYSNISS